MITTTILSRTNNCYGFSTEVDAHAAGGRLNYPTNLVAVYL